MTNGSRVSLNIDKIIAGMSTLIAVTTDIGSCLGRLQERRRQRRALARLDQHLLNDIGLSATVVQHETRRPFWR